MNIDMFKRKCPFCHNDAYSADVEIEGEFPEDRIEVRCQTCGDYHLLSKIVHVSDDAITIKSLKGKVLDVEGMSRINRYAHSEGKLILWLDSFDEVNKWEEIIDNYSQHYGGLRPYEVRMILEFESK
jgi:hypothetical protein